MTKYQIKMTAKKCSISPKVDGLDEVLSMTQQGAVETPKTLSDLISALGDMREMSDQGTLKDGDTFSIGKIQVAHVGTDQVMPDVEELPGKKKAARKAAETISFEARFYGDPATDYYLHVSVLVEGRLHKPAFAKHRLVSWKADAERGTVKVVMNKADAEKRELTWLDGVVSVEAPVEVEAAAA